MEEVEKAKRGPKKKSAAIAAAAETKVSPNDELTELTGIDYSNLKGEAFKEYNEVFNDLFDNDKYDFEMWQAITELKFKFNEDTGERTQVINGVTLMGNKPVQITRLTIRAAKELNKYATANKGDRNSKYYLLKKPTV